MNRKLLLAAALVLAVAGTSQAQPFAYSVNSGTRNVTVIDTVDNTIKATIPLPDTAQYVHPYAYGVTVGPSGQYVYVGLQDTNEVVMIDTARNTVVKRIGMGTNSPGGLAVNGSETRLYVTSHQSNLLLIYDISGSGANLAGAVTVSDQQVSSPEGVVLSPTGNKAYVANSMADSVAVISLDDVNGVYTRESLIPLTTEFTPMALTISADGQKLYVAGLRGAFKAIDLSQSPFGETSLSTGSGVLALAITPDNSKVYVPSNGYDYLFEITATDVSTAVTGFYPLAAGPLGISITPDGTKIYVTMNTLTFGDSVKVFSTTTNTVTDTIPLPAGANPTGIGNFIGPVFPYTITATQGPNCTILPLGPVAVNSLGRTFDITPSSGQCEVKVDGVSVGMPSSYAITNVSSNHTIDASQATAGTYYTLTASWSPETVGRCLQSSPSGIGCVSKGAFFRANSTVTLSATTGYQATNWGGSCAGTTGPTCTLVMDGDKSVTASVGNDVPCLAKRGATCYATIDDAINGASNGDLIKVIAAYTGPGISTSGGPFGTVTVSGGWDSSFSNQLGSSMIGMSTFRANCAIAVDLLSF